MLTYELAPKLSTGTGRSTVKHVEGWRTVAIEFEVEAIGATPTVTFTVQGQLDRTPPKLDDDPASPLWENLAYVRSDATTAASSAAQVITTVSKTILWVEGLEKRSFRSLAINVTANTNVTFSARMHVAEQPL